MSRVRVHTALVLQELLRKEGFSFPLACLACKYVRPTNVVDCNECSVVRTAREPARHLCSCAVSRRARSRCSLAHSSCYNRVPMLPTLRRDVERVVTPVNPFAFLRALRPNGKVSGAACLKLPPDHSQQPAHVALRLERIRVAGDKPRAVRFRPSRHPCLLLKSRLTEGSRVLACLDLSSETTASERVPRCVSLRSRRGAGERSEGKGTKGMKS